jgi:hypothetical protein
MKNQFAARKNGKIIEIRIIASSEEMADKFFDMIELFSTNALRIDLEREWRGDRP